MKTLKETKTVLKILVSALAIVALSSCGKSNRTGGDASNTFAVNGTEGAHIRTRVDAVVHNSPCYIGVRNAWSAFRINQANQYIGRVAVNFEANGAKNISIGTSQNNDVVVVKDYGQTKEVIISFCGVVGTPVVSQAVVHFMSSSPVTSCNINQISAMDMSLTVNGFYKILAIAPVNIRGPVPGVCTSGFYN